MRYVLVIVQLALGRGLFLCAIVPAHPHSGGLDAYGCHPNRKAVGITATAGLLAGQSFASKEQMLKKLDTEKRDDAVDQGNLGLGG